MICIVRVRHPDHDRSGIRDEAEAFFAFAQGLFGEGALDQIRGLPGEHVEESEIIFGRGMRRPPVRREHAEKPARSRSQRRRLHGADSRATIFLLIRRAGHEFARLDIGHHNALVVTERFAAGAPRSDRHPFPERRRVRVEIRPREEPQRRVVCGEHLDAGRIGRHQLHRRAARQRALRTAAKRTNPATILAVL